MYGGRRGEGERDVLDETSLNELMHMHFLSPVQYFIRFAQSEFINERSRRVYFCCDPDCCATGVGKISEWGES